MRVERLPAWGALGLNEAAWNRLVARSHGNLPFLTWQFQTTWWRVLGEREGSLHLLAVQDGAAEWVGALPLYKMPTPVGPVLRLVGGVDVADYLDLVAVAGHEEAVWKALLAALADGPWRALDLRPVPASSPTVALLPALARAAGLACRIESEDRCPVIELPASWDAYLAQLSGKDRHELRRKLRRAEKARARVEVARTPGGIAALLDSFVALHRKSKAGKARFMDERMEVFFREVGAALAAAGWAALWLLWLEDRPAAALFCLEYGGTVALYNSGFDPAARALSPGVVLIVRTVEDAIARGFRRYDFLRGDELYKYGFGAVPTEVLRLTLERAA
ncbi:MAG: GNAT family N-acetyltransferase [Candidatus Rokubacteria bacterium]|nr:GNAT family N-acetyltransferase [Candidatus Rokubacteria bacterium]